MAYLEEHRSRSAAEPPARPLAERRARLLQRLHLAAPAAVPWLLVLGVLLLWEAGVRLGLVAPLLFPAPSTIAAAGWKLLLAGVLLPNLGRTLARLGLGLLCGGSAGLALGLLMGWLPALRRALGPLVAAAHPIPKIAIFPLILVIFGMGETSKVVVTSLAAFFPMLVNTAAGVRHIQPIYFEVARNYGASRWLTIRRVVLPGSLPFVLAGLQLAFNLSLLMTIAVEMINSNDGVGWLLWRGWQVMRTEDVYVSLALVIAVGVSANRLIQWLSRQVVPWQVDASDSRD
jgi:ABC-type nitrate/sulfonate/bicarbonate transport system permease component